MTTAKSTTAKATAAPADPATTPDPAPPTDDTPATPPAASNPPANPAGAAIADAARDAEIRRLTEERDALRARVSQTPTLEILRAEVDALQQVAARTGVGGATRWTMSAGVHADLESRGYATDPATGAAYVRDGDRVTVTERSGKVRTVDMPKPSGAGENPAAAGRKN